MEAMVFVQGCDDCIEGGECLVCSPVDQGRATVAQQAWQGRRWRWWGVEAGVAG